MATRMRGSGFRQYALCATLAGLGLVAATTQAFAQATLSAGTAKARAGKAASVPITMKAGGAQVVNLGATFAVVAQGKTRAVTEKLTYQPATGLPHPDLIDNTSVPGSLAIGYVNNINPPVTGTVVMGTLTVPIPAGARGSYQVQVLRVSSLDGNGNAINITGQPGTITVGGGPVPPKRGKKKR